MNVARFAARRELQTIPLSVRPLLISKGREKNYLAQHGIFLEKLNNGATVIGMARNMVDSKEANINVRFPSGYFFDPPTKAGLHHLTEHLLNPPIRDFARKYDVTLNAFTSHYDLTHSTWGVANPHVLDFGVWPVLHSIYNALSFPLQSHLHPERAIEQEAEVIRREILENLASHDWRVWRCLESLVFDSLNPILSILRESEESLGNITRADVEHVIERIFIPEGLMVSVLSDGKPAECKDMVHKIASLVNDFPRKGKRRRAINWQLLDLLNTATKPGDVSYRDTGLKNNLVTILLVWKLSFPPLSSLSFSLNRLAYELSERIFKLAREMKWSYSAGASVGYGGDANTYFVARFNVPQKSRKALEALRKDAESKTKEIFRLEKAEVRRIIDSEHKRQEAVPFPINIHLDWMIYGLRRFGYLIDTDKVKARYRDITEAHIEHWLKLFIDTKPIVGMIGDLS